MTTEKPPDSLDATGVPITLMYMNPTAEPVPPLRIFRLAMRCAWPVVAGLFFAGLSTQTFWNSGPPKLHPQILLHTDLKTGGPLVTISYADSIRASMGKVEGYPVSQVRMIRPYFHPFLLMLHLGFASHRPVSISPDAVWLMICNGFATHAEVRGEDLQRRMFPQGRVGKVAIKVRRDDFQKGSNNDWESVFGEFTATMDGIMANDLKRTLTGSFSTTGAKEKAAFDVIFMKTMERSFGYEAQTCCGIPSITLEGTVQDWEDIAARAEKLRGYDCDWWLDALKPVLSQFTAAAGGKVDRNFWLSIYKVCEESGGDEVSGWCVLFFPYVKTYGMGGEVRTASWEKNVFLLDANEREARVAEVAKKLAEDPFKGPARSAEWYAQKAGKLIPKACDLFISEERNTEGTGASMTFTYRAADFGDPIARVPFVWDYLGKNHDMQFLAGFCGVSYDSETELLRAEIGWGVRDPQAGDLKEKDIWEEYSQNVHLSGRPAKRK